MSSHRKSAKKTNKRRNQTPKINRGSPVARTFEVTVAHPNEGNLSIPFGNVTDLTQANLFSLPPHAITKEELESEYTLIPTQYGKPLKRVHTKVFYPLVKGSLYALPYKLKLPYKFYYRLDEKYTLNPTGLGDYYNPPIHVFSETFNDDIDLYVPTRNKNNIFL